MRTEKRAADADHQAMRLGFSTFSVSDMVLESPVHNERCTPGSGTRAVETAESNLGMASRPYVHEVGWWG